MLARAIGGALALALTAVAGLACNDGAAFVCNEDSDCAGAGAPGQCEPTRYCSFPDETCPSGRRYGDAAVDGLATTCTDPDAGTGGTGTTGFPTGSDATTVPTSTSGPTTDPSETLPPTTQTSTTTMPTTATEGSATTQPLPVCGDGLAQGDEECDGEDVGERTCDEFVPGSTAPLTCGRGCTFDLALCSFCGNNAIDDGEVCDGTAPIEDTCVSVGFGAGQLGCATSCNTFDISGCDTCGNGSIEGSDICDGPQLQGQTCVSLGYGNGVLGCGDSLRVLRHHQLRGSGMWRRPERAAQQGLSRGVRLVPRRHLHVPLQWWLGLRRRLDRLSARMAMRGDLRWRFGMRRRDHLLPRVYDLHGVVRRTERLQRPDRQLQLRRRLRSRLQQQPSCLRRRPGELRRRPLRRDVFGLVDARGRLRRRVRLPALRRRRLRQALR